MTSLCSYKHIFGPERQGFHAIRFFDIAIGDLLLTILASYGLAHLFRIHIFSALLVMLALGVVVHRLFCVNTKINTLLFGKI